MALLAHNILLQMANENTDEIEIEKQSDEVRKTFMLPKGAYEMMKYIQEKRGIKNDTEVAIFCIIETYEMLLNKYGKPINNN